MIARIVVSTVFILVSFAAQVSAQSAQPTPGTDPHHPAPAQRPGGPPPGGTGGMGGMMGGMPMMMCPMMGGGMMSGMMGGGMMPGASPAESARMLQMRGEMLKAMGDILLKYGKMMEGARP